MLSHVINNLLNRYVDIVFDNSLVYISNYALYDTELLKQLPTRIQHLLREYILFTIYPKIGKALLSRVEYFGEIAQRSLLV